MILTTNFEHECRNSVSGRAPYSQGGCPADLEVSSDFELRFQFRKSPNLSLNSRAALRLRRIKSSVVSGAWRIDR
jgi:hypothetical protein